MALLSTVLSFREQDPETDPLKATWYLSGTAALVGAGAGEHVLSMYRSATEDLPLETAKLVQRRIKEAILKSTVFCGVPRTAAATRPFYRDLKDEEVDRFAPRFDSYHDPQEAARREARGKHFFGVLWTPAVADGVRETMKRHHPDLYLLNHKLIYEFWVSENRILDPIETELVAVAALITMDCAEPLTWHLKGAMRHGASEEQVKLAYEIGMAVARGAGLQLREMPRLEDVDLNESIYL